MKLEVRCCCDASKVLGYLDHPQLQKLGDRCVFPILEPYAAMPSHAAVIARTHLIELEVDGVSDPRVALGGYQLAIKNRDYPIEDLRRVPGFEEFVLDFDDWQVRALEGRGVLLPDLARVLGVAIHVNDDVDELELARAEGEGMVAR